MDQEEIMEVVAMDLHPVLVMALLRVKDIMPEHPTLVAMTDPHREMGEIDTGEGVVAIDLPEVLMNSRKQTPVSIRLDYLILELGMRIRSHTSLLQMIFVPDPS